eukprot:scaffold7210_cov63-Attheya_sp.AAC.6
MHLSFNFHLQANRSNLPVTEAISKLKHEGRVPNSWILLDNQSTMDAFHNHPLLTNICRGDSCFMDIHCKNTGVTSTNLVRDLAGYDGVVWYHPNGIARYSVTLQARWYRMHFSGIESQTLLYGCEEDIVLVNTVEDSKSKFSARDYSHTVLARKVQNTIGQPSTCDYMIIVERICSQSQLPGYSRRY